MIRGTLTVLGIILLVATPAAAQLDQLLRGLSSPPSSGLGDAKIVSGLKEALQVGTKNAVNLTGRPNGYFGNAAIKILMPDNLKSLESGLRAVGYGPQVDDFILSMNHAAEQAAPAARQIFVDAITAMTFDDATKILHGSDTAATEYFKDKTTDKLSSAFRPTVERAMNEVGVTRQYNALIGQARAIPFFRTESYDLNQYVVGKSLDGLFHVVGEEERKIRTNPTARVTDLLKDVFGSTGKR